jgi:hypothetical protein
MTRRILLLLAAASLVGSAQEKYDGPKPPKADLPYLKHASDLVATETATATEEKQKKDDILYVVAGASSPVKTPLASPIFILKSDQLSPDKLELYKLTVKNNRREILMGPKRDVKPIRIELTRLGGGLYRIEVDESLEPGEYSLTPNGSNQVFCFQVY